MVDEGLLRWNSPGWITRLPSFTGLAGVAGAGQDIGQLVRVNPIWRGVTARSGITAFIRLVFTTW